MQPGNETMLLRTHTCKASMSFSAAQKGALQLICSTPFAKGI